MVRIPEGVNALPRRRSLLKTGGTHVIPLIIVTHWSPSARSRSTPTVDLSSDNVRASVDILSPSASPTHTTSCNISADDFDQVFRRRQDCCGRPFEHTSENIDLNQAHLAICATARIRRRAMA
jgi:hypothetical protein